MRRLATLPLGECRLVPQRSLSKSAGGKKSTLAQLAVAGLDRALLQSRGKKPDWDAGARSVYDAVDRLACATTRGSLDKSLAPVLRDSTGVAVKVLRRLFRPEQAVEFFIWAAKQGGFKHNVETWNQLMDNFIRGGRALDAYELFKQRFSRMHKPDLSTYTILVNGLCEGKHPEQACELFNEMQRHGIQPGKPLVAILLNGLVVTGRLDDAVAYYQMMKDHKLDPDTYSALLSALGKHDRLDNSVKIMQDMIQRNCFPGAACLTDHVEVLCSKGRATDARKVLDQLLEKGFRMDSVLHTLVIESLCKAGSLEDAVDMFEEMIRRNCRRDMLTYTVIVEGLYNAGKLGSAFEFMERMVKDGCLPDAASFHSLLEFHGRIKREDDEKKGRRKPTVAMYSVLLFGLCIAGNVDEALSLYHHMLAGRSSPPSLLTYTVVIDGLGKAKRGTEAESVFKEMIRRGCMPEAVTYNVLLSALCASGLVTKAVEHFKEMAQRKCQPDLRTYMVLLEGLEKLDGAKDVVQHVKEAAEKRLAISENTYNAVVVSLNNAGM